ncbi:acyltransferase [Ruminiclostridium herbifermentans]|nr:acyltransferase family protein [Ruminiclostridium herbifermentans]
MGNGIVFADVMQEGKLEVPNKASNNRVAFVDTLKLLAILGVITIHISATPLTSLEIASLDWYVALFFGSIIRWAVPIFLMCSGVLFLKDDKVITTKQIFTKYLFRILCALFVWAAFYEAIDILKVFNRIGYIDYDIIYKSIKKILLFNTKSHLYYLYIVILIYSLLPIIRVFTGTASKSQIEYLIIAWLVLGIVLPFVIQFRPFSLIRGMVRQYPISMVYSAIGYFVLGHYMNKYTLKRWTNYLIYFLGVIGFLVTLWGTAFSSIANNSVYTLYLEGMSPNVAAMAAAIFLLVKNLNSREYQGMEMGSGTGRGVKRKVISYISKGSFCIYLVHIAIIDLLRALKLTFSGENTLITIPLLVFAVLMLSLGVYFILSKIPVVKRYLI